jgi:hypothetical protein
MVQISAKGIRVGEDAVIDVRVSSPTGTPAGAVTISVDGQVRATLTLDAAGSAQLRVSGLSEGRHPVVVVYGGTSTHAASSGGIELRVR